LSKTQDKKIKTKTEHAEFLWEQAQMNAALLQQTLDIATHEFEEHIDQLEGEVIAQVKQQIELRQKDIETYLMGEKDRYLERMGIQQD
jgi:predicted ArsR family transcriptional regulator